VHAILLVAGGGAIVKLYNGTTTHLSSDSAAWPKPRLRGCGHHDGGVSQHLQFLGHERSGAIFGIELKAHTNTIVQEIHTEDDIANLEGTTASPMMAIGPERMNDRAAHAGILAELCVDRGALGAQLGTYTIRLLETADGAKANLQ
jgi:hypothetical protein